MVRIPYFIQLTNEVIEKMFGATVKEKRCLIQMYLLLPLLIEIHLHIAVLLV